VRMWKRTP